MGDKLKVAVFTSSRADFGILRNTIAKLNDDLDISVQIYVSGSHLSDKFGRTIEEVHKTGVKDIFTINSLIDNYDTGAIPAGCGMGIIELTKLVNIEKPDLLVLLGDRYELLIPATVCVINRIPIVHIHGGEVTEGALDEQIRHAVTKMSHIHLVSARKYAFNVSSMGEEDWRIQIVGALGLENIKKMRVISDREIEEKTGMNINGRTFLCTYHPVTLENELSVNDQLLNLFGALDEFKDYQIIFTSPGADPGSDAIIESIQDYVKKRNNSYFFKSLGSELYINIAKRCDLVIGNSSSGVIEMPTLKIPTVNIGNRQKGRECAKSVINCGYYVHDIVNAIKLAISKEFKNKVDNFMNPYDPYEDDRFSERVVKVIKNIDRDVMKKNKILDFTVDCSNWNYLLKTDL